MRHKPHAQFSQMNANAFVLPPGNSQNRSIAFFHLPFVGELQSSLPRHEQISPLHSGKFERACASSEVIQAAFEQTAPLRSWRSINDFHSFTGYQIHT